MEQRDLELWTACEWLGTATVRELAAATQQTPASVRRGIRRLEAAGVVVVRRELRETVAGRRWMLVTSAVSPVEYAQPAPYGLVRRESTGEVLRPATRIDEARARRRGGRLVVGGFRAWLEPPVIILAA